MKILIGTPYFYPKTGGLENYAYGLAKGLKKTFGWDVVVVTSNHKGKKDIVEKLDGMTIYRLAPLFKLSNTPVNPFWIFKVRKILNKENPDIINAHTPVPFMADILSLVSLRTPFVLTYHAVSLYKEKGSLFNSIVWAYKQWESFILKRSDKIITVSKFVADMLPQENKKKTVIINNFIDMQTLLSRRDVGKSNTIIFVGSLDKTHAWKGLDKIIKATKLLVDAYGKNIKLVVLGDGNNKKEYIKIAKELNIEKSIKFLGQKVGSEKMNLLKSAKVAILYPTTSNDALPTFLLEAWASKTSVVASDIYPISKIIKNHITGNLIEPNNSSQLAKGILDVLDSKNKRKSLETNGYEEVKKMYSFEMALNRFNSTLQKEIIRL